MEKSLSDLIYNILLKTENFIHYKEINNMLLLNGVESNIRTINSILSQTSIFESDNKGNWRIIGRSEIENIIKNQIINIFEKNKKPYYLSEITSILIKKSIIKPGEEFLVKRILIGNKFPRWATSIYWSTKREYFPTLSVSEFYRKNIIEFMEKINKPIIKNILADEISKETDIYINPDGGFAAEISRLTKSDTIRYYGKSIISPSSITQKEKKISLKEMIYNVFINEQKQMKISEIIPKLISFFSVNVNESSISAVLSTDNRFVSIGNNDWILNLWDKEKIKLNISKTINKNEILSRKISEINLSNGVLKLNNKLDKFDSQLILKAKSKPFLVNYNIESSEISGLKELYENLNVKRKDVLKLKIVDTILKVYSIEKIKENERKIVKHSITIPSISSEKYLYIFKDLFERYTNKNMQGEIYLPGISFEIYLMLKNFGITVKLIPKNTYSEYFIDLLSLLDTEKKYLFKSLDNWTSEQKHNFDDISKKIFSINRLCEKCNEKLIVYKHEVGINSFYVICSNKKCDNSAIRRSKKIKLKKKEINDYENDTKNISKNYNNFHKFFIKEIDNIQNKNKFAFRTTYILNYFLNKIEKIKYLNLKKLLFLGLIKYINSLNSKIMVENNFFIYKDIFLRKIKKIILENQYTNNTINNVDFIVIDIQNKNKNLNFDNMFLKNKENVFKYEDIINNLKSNSIVFLSKERDFTQKSNNELIKTTDSLGLKLLRTRLSIVDNKEIFAFEKI